jgi:two-component system, OmpR family, response regulator
MKHGNVLIVDDERRYADMLARRLRLRGLACQVRYDGRTAVDIVAREFFPLVLLDLRLPDIYGIEVLSRIKRSRPETVVIILSGHGTDRDREQCMAQGAHAFMNKPVDIDRLMAVLARIKEKSS